MYLMWYISVKSAVLTCGGQQRVQTPVRAQHAGCLALRQTSVRSNACFSPERPEPVRSRTFMREPRPEFGPRRQLEHSLLAVSIFPASQLSFPFFISALRRAGTRNFGRLPEHATVQPERRGSLYAEIPCWQGILQSYYSIVVTTQPGGLSSLQANSKTLTSVQRKAGLDQRLAAVFSPHTRHRPRPDSSWIARPASHVVGPKLVPHDRYQHV